MSSSTSTNTYPNATSIHETVDSSGNVISYECEYLLSATSNNTFPEELIPAYYDLRYPCDYTNIDQAVAFIENTLLQLAAQAWHISSNSTGQGCIDPTIQPYNTMLVAVSSSPLDRIIESMKCVLKDKPLAKGDCCKMVKSEMTFTPQGRYDSMKLIRFVASQLDSGILTDGTTYSDYSTTYAGSFAPPTTPDTLDTSSLRNNNTGIGNFGDTNTTTTTDGTIASISSNAESQKGRERFTPIGGVVLGGLVLAFLVSFFLFTRRRRLKRHRGYYGSDDDLIMMKDGVADPNHRTPPTLPVRTLEDLNDLSMGTITMCDSSHIKSNHPQANENCTANNDIDEAFEVAVLGDDHNNLLYINAERTLTQDQTRLSKSSPNIVVPVVEVPINPSSSSFENSSISRTDSCDESLDSNSIGNKKKCRYGTTIGYAFDLGQSFKNDIMSKHDGTAVYRGNSRNPKHQQPIRSSPNRTYNNNNSTSNTTMNSKHAPTLIEVVPPYPMMEETSDSEVDSWAQTDGNSIRSLEERLDDVTGEI